MYEPLSRCDIAVETPTSVNKNVSIGVATSPGPIVEVAGRTGQKPPASSTKQRKKHTSAPPQGGTGCRNGANQRDVGPMRPSGCWHPVT